MDKKPRKQEILQIASKMFFERGFDGTSMRDLAKKVGLTTAGLYHHIQSKDDLLNEVDKLLLDDFDKSLKLDEKWRENPEESLKKLIRRLAQIILDQKELLSIVRTQAISMTKFAGDSRLRRKKLVEETEKILNKLKKEVGTKKDIDVTVATFILIGIINWIPWWFKEDGRISKKKVIEMISLFFTKGFLK